MENRTNYVKVDNLPPGLTGKEIFDYFDPFGDLLEMTAVGPSSVVLTYMRRSSARNCVQLIHNQLYIHNNIISAVYFYPRDDPNYASSPILQGLGRSIGVGTFTYNYTDFVPWNQTNGATGASDIPRGASALTLGDGASSLPPGASALPPGAPSLPHGASSLPPGASSLPPGASSLPHGASSRLHGASLSSDSSESLTRRKVQIGGPFSQILAEYSIPWRLPSNGEEVDECAICLEYLGEPGTYNIYSDQSRALALIVCNHAYHQVCLEALLLQGTTPFLQCPTCKRVYGTRTGTRPLTGTIRHSTCDVALRGHEQYRTIEIVFNFTPGLQGPEHPHPGRPFMVRDFPRKAYLPSSPEGIRALHGIYVAWEQRLIFTVGQSLTTSRDDVITWNDIHMKTKMESGEHGYPDPLYLTNLFQELKGFGITEATISSHMHKYPALKDRGRL